MLILQTSGSSFAIYLWLFLFVAAGFLLLGFKVAGDGPTEKWSKLRVFLLIAVVWFAVAGIADFVRWVNQS